MSHAVTLQWIPSHCNVPGNEVADSLVKEAKQKSKWTGLPSTPRWRPSSSPSNTASRASRYNKTDPYYLLTRREQVTVFRLSTGHNCLNHHLYSKLRNGHTEQCPCGTGSHTTKHQLQSCTLYELLRKGIWPDHTPVACKLYGVCVCVCVCMCVCMKW